MTDKETLKLALEALQKHAELGLLAGATITAIKEALAQPEQDTVQRLSALVRAQQITIDKLEAQQEQEPIEKNMTLACPSYLHDYTTPSQRKPLTLGQKQRLWSSVGDKPTLKDRVNAYGLAIEAAHGIKEKNNG